MAALLSQCSRKQSQSGSSGTALAQTQIYHSEGGLLSVDLDAKAQPVRLGNRRANLLTYNAQVPGPQLEAKPGDTVQIRFTNRLNQPTNLHYHGLHIPPRGQGTMSFSKFPLVRVIPTSFRFLKTTPLEHFGITLITMDWWPNSCLGA